jgi:uncharacterized membrane protein HdeD (DUF308 family)
MQRATATDGVATPRNEALAGFVLSLLGLLASLYPGDLLVALPLLFAGLYVSIAAFRVASRVAASRRLAIAGAVIGVLGLITTVILFVVFIE